MYYWWARKIIGKIADLWWNKVGKKKVRIDKKIDGIG